MMMIIIIIIIIRRRIDSGILISRMSYEQDDYLIIIWL